MTSFTTLPLVPLVALVAAALLVVSLALYAWLCRRMPRMAAAIVAPLLAMALGSGYATYALLSLPPDAPAMHLLVLSPPFVFGIILPIITALQLWVLLTRRRA